MSANDSRYHIAGSGTGSNREGNSRFRARAATVACAIALVGIFATLPVIPGEHPEADRNPDAPGATEGVSFEGYRAVPMGADDSDALVPYTSGYTAEEH